MKFFSKQSTQWAWRMCVGMANLRSGYFPVRTAYHLLVQKWWSVEVASGSGREESPSWKSCGAFLCSPEQSSEIGILKELVFVDVGKPYIMPCLNVHGQNYFGRKSDMLLHSRYPSYTLTLVLTLGLFGHWGMLEIMEEGADSSALCQMVVGCGLGFIINGRERNDVKHHWKPPDASTIKISVAFSNANHQLGTGLVSAVMRGSWYGHKHCGTM